MSPLSVAQLAIYPVKSMRQERLEKTAIDMGGLKNDRRWMVVDVDGRMITQRQQPRLCLVQPESVDDGLRLHVSGQNDCQVNIPDGSSTADVIVWNDRCRAFDAGDMAAEWLSRFLKRESRLVYFPNDEVRQVDQNYAEVNDRTAFSDGFPVLLVSQASLDDLNRRMEKNIPMVRFRPNLVISGCEAYAEDSWKRLRLGDLALRMVKPCSRCLVPGIDIDTAECSQEPARTLATYRKQGNKVFFGQNAIIDGEGEISTGMEVEVIE